MTAPAPCAATIARQIAASMPDRSIWVSANAGSGKTHILALRAIRLLLGGARPESLVCLTYTRVAAAEMAARIFTLLGGWVRLDDGALRGELANIEGVPAADISADTLRRARRLFADCLETPGGLKIQTVHGFCEALLRQFPLEAGVFRHFRIDETQCKLLLDAARDAVLERAGDPAGGGLHEAFRQVTTVMNEDGLGKALKDLVHQRNELTTWVYGQAPGPASAATQEAEGAMRAAIRRRIAAAMGLCEEEEDPEAITQRMIRDCLFDSAVLAGVRAAFAGKSRPVVLARLINHFSMRTDAPEQWVDMLLTREGTPRKAFFKETLRKAVPEFVELLAREQDRLIDLKERRACALSACITAALVGLALEVNAQYRRAKLRAGLLDFDDLIFHTAHLLEKSPAAAWVHYKLDPGIDHIVIDEAQDTNPRQWQIVERLAGEFFAGKGSREDVRRTVFAVGDKKQSIYSFQGAAPDYFDAMRRKFGKADPGFSALDLHVSFRSLPAILSAVDKVFSDCERGAGVCDDGPLVHEGMRRDGPGCVEIWQCAHSKDAEPGAESVAELEDDWLTALDPDAGTASENALAGAIARDIAGQIAQGGVQAGNVLILLRERNEAQIQQLITALNERAIPVSGKDRAGLRDHIAIDDLIALGRFVLLEHDDMALACVLRSPLCGICEDELFALARPDGRHHENAGLWHKMRTAFERGAPCARHFERLSAWRAHGFARSPFEFYAAILSGDGVRQRLRQRFGRPVDDVLDEFLAAALAHERHEHGNLVSLEAFLNLVESGAISIRRDNEAGGDGVRIMTVHAAKGTEAHSVFLIDSGKDPAHHNHDPCFLPLAMRHGKGEGYCWVPPKARRATWHTRALAEDRKRQLREYRRMLYVGMTRARDRLVICGGHAAKLHDESWFCTVLAALRDGSDMLHDPAACAAGGLDDECEEAMKIWRWRGGPRALAAMRDTSDRASVTPTPAASVQGIGAAQDHIPGWLYQPVEMPPAPQPLRPSRSGADRITLSEAGAVHSRNAPARDAWARRGPERGQESRQALDGAPPNARDADARPSADGPPPDTPTETGIVQMTGTALHFLLAALRKTAPDARAGRAYTLALHCLPPALAGRAGEICAEALGIVASPALAGIFGPDGHDEVALAGTIDTDAGKRAVSGVIDRLIIDPGRVWIIDYKSTRSPAQGVRQLAPDIMYQMALYHRLARDIFPHHTLRVSILWTHTRRLMDIPPGLLDAALEGL